MRKEPIDINEVEVKINKNCERNMMIPKFMLKKLYVQGSLKQDEEEYTFQLLNNLYPGTVKEVEYIKVDNEELDHIPYFSRNEFPMNPQFYSELK